MISLVLNLKYVCFNMYEVCSKMLVPYVKRIFLAYEHGR